MALLYLHAAASEREAWRAQQEAGADFRRAVAAKEVAEQGLVALQEHYVTTGRLVEMMTVRLLDDPAFRSPLLAPFRERLLALGAAYFGGMQGKASPPGAPAGQDALWPLKAQAALSLGVVLLERGEAPAALAVARRGMELLQAASGAAPEDVFLQGERVRGHVLLARIAEAQGDRAGRGRRGPRRGRRGPAALRPAAAALRPAPAGRGGS
ncbi:MAG: hypothetical protein U0797_05005 [Gemmataceae bacterium]